MSIVFAIVALMPGPRYRDRQRYRTGYIQDVRM